MLDIKNKKFGKLTVLEYLFKNKNGYSVWKCLCDCGQFTTAQTRFLNNGSKVSCGCQRKQIGPLHPAWRGCGELSAYQFNHIKSQSKIRKLNFNLSLKYLWNLFLTQNRKCSISDEEISFSKSRRCLGTTSLDRIDSSKGYVKKNVQWLHVDVNYMKWKLSETRFFELISKIHRKNLR